MLWLQVVLMGRWSLNPKGLILENEKNNWLDKTFSIILLDCILDSCFSNLGNCCQWISVESAGIDGRFRPGRKISSLWWLEYLNWFLPRCHVNFWSIYMGGIAIIFPTSPSLQLWNGTVQSLVSVIWLVLRYRIACIIRRQRGVRWWRFEPHGLLRYRVHAGKSVQETH